MHQHHIREQSGQMGRMPGMGGGRMGMMRGMGMGMGMGVCPCCGRPMSMMGMLGGQAEEEGPYRGRGPAQARWSDEQIKAAAEEALTDDSWLDASAIRVGVQNGVVTLTGTVVSRAAKRQAEDAVDETPGVRDVQNQLQIVE